MAGVLVILCFVDTFLTGFLLRSVRDLRSEHELFREQHKWVLKCVSAYPEDFDGFDDVLDVGGEDE